MSDLPPKANPDEIRRAVAVLAEPGSVVELRCPATPQGTVSGYYDDPERLAQDAAAWSGAAAAVYLTLNPVNPEVRARAYNRVETFAKYTTKDDEILRRRWLLIDCDPARPKGVSSTAAEASAARGRAAEVRRWLLDRGWPEPVCADSGNGVHLLFRVDLPNEPAARDLLQGVLIALYDRFSDAAVTIDRTNFNAARVCKLYGTLAAKGDPLPERPHRLARLLHVPELVLVEERLLDALAQEAVLARTRTTSVPAEINRKAPPVGAGDYATLEVVTWFQAHGCYGRDMGGGKHAVRCPWDAEHSDLRRPEESDTVIWEAADGRWPTFCCLHAHCAGRTLAAVVALWEDAPQFCARAFTKTASWPAGGNGHGAPPFDPAPGVPAPEGALPELFRLARLRRLDTDPPRFFPTVEGFPEFEVPLDHLLEWKLFKRACVAHLNYLPRLRTEYDSDHKRYSAQTTWEIFYLHPVLRPDMEILPAPPDASRRGVLWESILRFVGGWRSLERWDLHRNEIVVVDDAICFRGEALRLWFSRNRIEAEAGELWSIIRERGGGCGNVRTPRPKDEADLGTAPVEDPGGRKSHAFVWKLPAALLDDALLDDALPEDLEEDLEEDQGAPPREWEEVR